MKQIKWILYTLYVASYTSLAWAAIIWDGLKVGSNNVEIGLIGLILLTILNISVIIIYLCVNWNEG